MYNLLVKLDVEFLRIEKIISIAGALSDGLSMSKDLEDFFVDEDLTDIERCLGRVPLGVRFIRREDLVSDVFNWLVDVERLGFLVKFEKQIPIGGRYSWSRVTMRWVYAESALGALKQGLRFARENQAKGE